MCTSIQRFFLYILFLSHISRKKVYNKNKSIKQQLLFRICWLITSVTGTVFCILDFVNINLRNNNKISLIPGAHSLEFSNDKRKDIASP